MICTDGDKIDLPKRKANRLKNYDYSKNAAYFITVCTKDRHEILWNVGATFGRPQKSPTLSEYGIIIKNELDHIGKIYDNVVAIDKYVIMPNHIHIIILLHGGDGRPKVAPTVSRIMQQFKGAVTKQIGFSLWQKSIFHLSIIITNKTAFA